jgi:hypothetical protein
MPILPVTTHTGPVQRAHSYGRSIWLAAAYWVLGLWAATLTITTAYLYLVTGGSFDYVEGVALGHQLMSAGGVPMYGAPADQPPYSVPLYGPVYYTIYGLLLDTAAPSFTPARVLNLLLTVYLIGLALYVARQRLGVSTAAACLAVLCWLSLEPAAGFLLQNRPDTLALAFAASGFMAAISERRSSLPLAVLLLTAAAYTKQTAVVAPLLAAVLVLLGTRRVRDAAVLLFATRSDRRSLLECRGTGQPEWFFTGQRAGCLAKGWPAAVVLAGTGRPAGQSAGNRCPAGHCHLWPDVAGTARPRRRQARRQ